MKILILEDDELMADLLGTVVSGIYPSAQIVVAERLHAGLADWRSGPADLVIADWNLPDGSGLDLVREVKRYSRDLPVVVVSGRSDRESILAAATLGINGYISKPFSVELVHERLTKLIDPASLTSGDLQSVSDRLKFAAESSAQLPGSLDAAAVLTLAERQDEFSPAHLAERWRKEPALSAKILEVANRRSLRRSGTPIHGVKDAITAIGVPMAINQALAMALDVAGQLPDRRLRDLATDYQEQSEQLALEAQRMATHLGEKGDLFYTAGLLSRVGELVSLRIIQQHLAAGNSLTDVEIQQALRDWAPAVGNSVKIQWRLSLKLRDLIGAVFLLQKETVVRDRLIMRAAALRMDEARDEQQYRRLLRQLRLSDTEGGLDGKE